MTKRFALYPRLIYTPTRQLFYVGAAKLAGFYGVGLQDCEVHEPTPQWTIRDYQDAEVRCKRLIPLTVRADGNYRRPA